MWGDRMEWEWEHEDVRFICLEGEFSLSSQFSLEHDIVVGVLRASPQR